MTAARSVGADEMKMVAGDIERAGIGWRPEADQAALDVVETEFALVAGGGNQIFSGRAARISICLNRPSNRKPTKMFSDGRSMSICV